MENESLRNKGCSFNSRSINQQVQCKRVLYNYITFQGILIVIFKSLKQVFFQHLYIHKNRVLRQIVSGQEKSFKMAEISNSNFPFYPELSVFNQDSMLYDQDLQNIWQIKNRNIKKRKTFQRLWQLSKKNNLKKLYKILIQEYSGGQMNKFTQTKVTYEEQSAKLKEFPLVSISFPLFLQYIQLMNQSLYFGKSKIYYEARQNTSIYKIDKFFHKKKNNLKGNFLKQTQIIKNQIEQT